MKIWILFSRGKNNILLTRCARLWNIVLPLKNKIHIFAPLCNILYMHSTQGFSGTSYKTGRLFMVQFTILVKERVIMPPIQWVWILGRPPQQLLRTSPTFYQQYVGSLPSHRMYCLSVKMEPTVCYLIREETVCRCHYKGSNFSHNRVSVGQARVFNQQPPFSADRHLSNWIVVHCKLYIVKAHYTSTYRVSSIRQNFCPLRGDSCLSRFNICLLLLKAKVKYKTINIEAQSSPVFLHLKAPHPCLSTSFPSL